MSTKIYTAQKSRPYKVEVFGLQDDYIGTLQSFADLSIGRVQDPKVTLSGDGTQEFTCSIPKFYINPKTNEKIINPRWEDIKNGVLAENTRVLKVFVIEEGETKVYPFIVDEIIDKRDSHFSVYKEITASGLAFAELGKVGLRLELNKDVVEADYKKDKNTVATLNYWLDKVFPRDESGRWLTPWSYEIRMDWSNYSDKDYRETDKMYDDIQVDKWDVTEDGKLIPAGTSKLQEKARYINSDKGSNKYNITQTIAETFGIFCVYEYKCEANGQFVKTYVDENGHNMTGRTAVFYNRAIKTDNPFTLDYQKNLQSISRTCDSTEVYTKLFVDPIQSDTMTDGYVTIANTAANPLMDEFILNFDYLYSKGSITEYQKDFIDKYSVEIHEINEDLRNKGELINLLTVEINDKKAEKAGAEKSVSAIQEELTHYQTLRDNDVTNTPVIKDKNNSYSVAFVKDNDKTSPYYRADLRLEGILSSSINGYKNYKYEEAIFTSKNLISSQDFKPVAENDKNMYVVLDEDGYAIGLYTGYAELFKADDLENDYIFDTGYIVYLALQYSPHNKYVEVCNRFERMIAKNKKQIAICDTFIESKQTELDGLITSQSELLARKNSLNQKFEYIMGPALREGHWSAEDYEDIGRRTEATVKVGDEAVDGVSLVFDAELFDGEEKGYYYASAEDANNNIKTYYDYIDISSHITNWEDKNPEDLVIHLTQPEFRYTVTKSQVNGLAAGNYFILYNMTKYYFSLKQALETGNILRIQSFSGENIDPPITLQMSTDKGQSWEPITLFKTVEEDVAKQSANLTDIFEGLNKYLSTYKIYPNAGFIYGFISQEEIAEDSTDKTTTAVKPVLLLNNPEINYSIYKQIGYSFGNENIESYSLYKTNEKLIICHPRIVVAKNNVNYDDDLLTITEENVEKALVKFEDYSVLLRNGQPRFNLKVTKNTTPYSLLNKNYTIAYRVSQANEMLYRDALEVARENSRPRFSYDVSVAQLPDTVESYELGQLGYINDSALGVKAAKGYISSITLVLDSPKDDEIQIQNYKTKFEDLFATITASSEAMKTNQQSYDIAASIINPSTGSIQGSILQDSFNNNKIELTYSNTQVHIDDTDGITLTNTEPYSNGVYGQVVMRGGGIFLSNTVDSNYNRIWTTGVTPNGINASMITTGQLDANLVRIFAGNNVAFQWNSEGIYAYKRDEETNSYLPNTYVRYSDKGLQYLDDGFVVVDLGWNGLTINSQDGSLSLTGKDGLIVYDGLKNEDGTNHVVSLGRFGEEGNYSYGLKLYKKDETGVYVETLVTDNEGQLWLKDYLAVGADKPYDASFQWERSLDKTIWKEVQVETSKNATLEIIPTSDNGNYYYRCKINHPKYGIFYSQPAKLEIVNNNNFYISKHPSSQTTLQDSYVTYSVEAVGTNLTYQWQWKRKNADESTWEDSVLTGNKTAAIEVQALSYRKDFEYRVIITNESGEQLISESATLYIVSEYTGKTIKAQPNSVGAIEDASSFVTFTVESFEETIGASGISGLEENGSRSVRFWAGDSFANRSIAPFRVLHDGSVYASKLVIGSSTGDMTASELIDQVGGLQDSVDSLGTQAAQLSIRTISTAGQIYNSGEENPETTLLTEIYLGEIRLTGSQLDEQGYESRKLIYYKKGLSDTEWVPYSTPIEDTNGAYQTTNIKMEVGVQYKAELTYVYHGLSYKATGTPITFTMVSNGDGLPGKDGVGITNVTEYYYNNNIETAPEPKVDDYNDLGIKYGDDGRTIIEIKMKSADEDGWQTDLNNPTKDIKYLWNIEKTDYSDGTNTYTQPALIARYTQDGVGISEIINWYKLGPIDATEDSLKYNPSEIWDPSSDGWSTSSLVTEDKESKRCLWNFEEIVYTNKTEYTSPAIIGTHGVTGETGASISKVEEYYFTNNIETPLANEGDFNNLGVKYVEGEVVAINEYWQTAILPAEKEKPYIWNIEEISYSDGRQPTYTHPVIIARYTEDGRGIVEITNWYCLGNADAPVGITDPDFGYDTIQPFTVGESLYPEITDKNSGWSATNLSTSTFTNEKRLWNFERIVYSDNTYTCTTPVVIGVHGESAANYRLQASSYSITRDLIVPLSPTQLTFKVQAIEGKTSSILEDITNYKLKIYECKNNTETELDLEEKEKVLYFQSNITLSNGTKVSSEILPGYTLKKDETIISLNLYYGTTKNTITRPTNWTPVESFTGLSAGYLWVDCQVETTKGTSSAGNNCPTRIYSSTVSNLITISTSSEVYFVDSTTESLDKDQALAALKRYLFKNTDNWVFDISSDEQNYATNGVDSFNIELLDSNDNALDKISVSFGLGDDLKELGKIKNGEVVIKDGKVHAESIAAYAVTAGKIAAGAITADKIATNAITTDKIATDFDLEIGAGRSINIATGGTFTVASDNFTITDEGNVSLTGNITAESGSIGGWNINEYGLYSGEGSNYVALSSDANQTYSIWAGAEDPSQAAFAVTKEGHVYLEKVYVQTDIDDNGNPIYATKSLTEYPLWAIWPGYSHSVKVLEVQGDTLNIELYNGTKVNFNKAAVNSQNYTILFGGSGVNLTAQLYKNDSTPVLINGVYSSASLVLEKDVNESYANGKVTISTVNSAPNAPMASISVAPVYEAGIDFAKTKIGINTNIETKTLQVDESIYIRAQATYDGNGIGNTLEAATISAPTTADIISNLSVTLDPAQDTTLDFGETLTITAIPKYNEKSGASEYILIKAPDGTEKYNQGWNDCVDSMNSGITCYTTSNTVKTGTFYDSQGNVIGSGVLLTGVKQQILYNKPIKI